MGNLWEKRERRNKCRWEWKKGKTGYVQKRLEEQYEILLSSYEYSEDHHHGLCVPKSLIFLLEKHKVRTWNEIGRWRKTCPGYSTVEFQMESDIKPGESLLKWAKYKFTVFSWSLNHQILSKYNWLILKAANRANITCCVLPFPSSLDGLSEQFQLNVAEPDYVIGI